MGQLIGNYTAAYATGVLDLESLIKIIWKRGNTAQYFMDQYNSEKKYSMLAINEKSVVKLPEGVYITGRHTPEFYTVSGTQDNILKLKNDFEKRGCKVSEIPLSVPFHTPYIGPLGISLKSYYQKFRWNNPSAKVKFISDFKFNGIQNTNNLFITGTQVRDKLLCEQLINPMEWSNIGEIFKNEGITHVLIIGPGKEMVPIIRKNCSKIKDIKILAITKYFKRIAMIFNKNKTLNFSILRKAIRFKRFTLLYLKCIRLVFLNSYLQNYKQSTFENYWEIFNRCHYNIYNYLFIRFTGNKI